MQRTVLIGALLDAFKENDFWTLRALNDKLKQPEQYLLWNLETLADLSEGGEHDGTYKLKPEVRDWMYYENCYEDYEDYGLSTS
jgi:transcription initiation factor TFIIF subunit beta